MIYSVFEGKKWVPLEEAQKFDEAWFIKYNVLKEKIVEANKILSPKLDFLKINRSKEGTYKIVLSYEEITFLREVLK